MNPGLKLKGVKVQTFTAATPTALQTAITAWITSNAGEKTMLDFQYSVDASGHHALLLYSN